MTDTELSREIATVQVNVDKHSHHEDEALVYLGMSLGLLRALLFAHRENHAIRAQALELLRRSLGYVRQHDADLHLSLVVFLEMNK